MAKLIQVSKEYFRGKWQRVGFYGDSEFERVSIINRRRYKGKGRPRDTDYMSVIEAQKQLNEMYNRHIDKIIIKPI